MRTPRRARQCSNAQAPPSAGRRLASASLALLGGLGATVAIAQAARTAGGGVAHSPSKRLARANPATGAHRFAGLDSDTRALPRARADSAMRDAEPVARAAASHGRAAAHKPRAPQGAVGRRGLVGLAGIAGEVGPIGPAGPPGPPGIVDQSISIDWQNGNYGGRDSASFVAPGVGQGEVICSLNTQWINFTPYDQGDDSEMWAAIMHGQEVSVRAAARRASSWGSEFNLGLNRAKNAVEEEPEAQGSMVGIISSRGPFGSPGEPGPPPTTFHLSWYWSFNETEGGSRCYVAATFATGG
jgi:hypothetical protein